MHVPLFKLAISSPSLKDVGFLAGVCKKCIEISPFLFVLAPSEPVFCSADSRRLAQVEED
jgi:hypothetical protein